MPEILIVDDERDLLTLLDFNLKQEGFRTVLASSGAEALAALRREPPDLVVLDLMLPDVSGTEVCRSIKADPRTKHVPVVMLTAKGQEIDRVVGFEVGADDYVTKPFSVNELQARVRISDDELNRVVELDHGFMADRRADWTDRWNRVVAGG